MKNAGGKSVTIIGSGGKRPITSTFIINLVGHFLPVQLTYGEKSIPNVVLLKGFPLNVNANYSSNDEETKKSFMTSSYQTLTL